MGRPGSPKAAGIGRGAPGGSKRKATRRECTESCALQRSPWAICLTIVGGLPPLKKGGWGGFAFGLGEARRVRPGSLAGRRPAARHFLCSCKESNQRKHALLPPKSPAGDQRRGRLANSPRPCRGSDSARRRPPRRWPPAGGGRRGEKRWDAKGLVLCKGLPRPQGCAFWGFGFLGPLGAAESGERAGGLSASMFESRRSRGELRSRPSPFPRRGNPKGGDVGRAFFGDFLCTSKESHAPPGASRPTTSANPSRLGKTKSKSPPPPFCKGGRTHPAMPCLPALDTGRRRRDDPMERGAVASAPFVSTPSFKRLGRRRAFFRA